MSDDQEDLNYHIGEFTDNNTGEKYDIQVFVKNDLSISHDNDWSIKRPTNIIFNNENGEEVGRIDWGGGQVTFEGNFDESAKKFVEYINNHFVYENL